MRQNVIEHTFISFFINTKITILSSSLDNNISGSLLMSMRGWIDESKENMTVADRMDREKREKEKQDARIWYATRCPYLSN